MEIRLLRVYGQRSGLERGLENRTYALEMDHRAWLGGKGGVGGRRREVGSYRCGSRKPNECGFGTERECRVSVSQSCRMTEVET